MSVDLEQMRRDLMEAAPAADPAATPPAGSAPAPASGEGGDSEVQALRRELEQVKQRFADTQRWGHDANQARIMADAMLNAERARAAEAEAQRQRAAAAEPPALPDPEELINDPRLLRDAMVAIAKWARESTLAEMTPHLREFHQMQGAMQTLQAEQVRRAKEAAKALAEENGFDDFDEVWPHVEVQFRGYEYALTDHENVFDNYVAARRRMGKKFPSAQQRQSLPPRGPASGPRGHAANPAERPDAQTSEFVERIKRTLGSDLKDWSPSQATLDTARMSRAQR